VAYIFMGWMLLHVQPFWRAGGKSEHWTPAIRENQLFSSFFSSTTGIL